MNKRNKVMLFLFGCLFLILILYTPFTGAQESKKEKEERLLITINATDDILKEFIMINELYEDFDIAAKELHKISIRYIDYGDHAESLKEILEKSKKAEEQVEEIFEKNRMRFRESDLEIFVKQILDYIRDFRLMVSYLYDWTARLADQSEGKEFFPMKENYEMYDKYSMQAEKYYDTKVKTYESLAKLKLVLDELTKKNGWSDQNRIDKTCQIKFVL